MPDRRSVLLGLAAAGLTPLPSLALTSTRLNEAARASGLFFGSALLSEQLTAGDAYTGLLLDQCDVWTPEGEIKWGPIALSRTFRDYSGADIITTWAKASGKRVRGHALIWHEQMPDWAENLDSAGDWDTYVAPHVYETAARYTGQIFQWDVVNEAIQPDDGLQGGLRNSPFYKMLGPDYLAEAFRIAHEAAPDARLYLNEYGMSYDERWQARKRDGLLRLADSLLARDVPLHGIGIQAHLNIRDHFSDRVFADFLGEIAARGLEITITELDVTEGEDNSSPIEARRVRAAEEVRKVMTVAVEQTALQGIVTWTLSDRASWLRRVRGIHDNQGLPFTDELEPSPMYEALVEVMANAPSRAD